MGSSKKQKWKTYFQKSASDKSTTKEFPKEFLCPISGTLMMDPVIVSSGHTFERNSVEACMPLLSTPSLPHHFSPVIPNLALKSAILNWCRTNLTYIPKPIDSDRAEKLAIEYMKSHDIPLATRSSCSSSWSSSEVDVTASLEEGEFLERLRSSNISEQEGGLVLLRKVTRTQEESRSSLCTPGILNILKLLSMSKCMSIQVNSVAVLVNLSLDKKNKVNIVRSGIVPCLIDVLKGGFLESRDHAAGALFSLALEDQNKTAIGVLGGLQPLLHSLRSESERTRHDSALALYHLTLVQSNRAKLVKFGGIQSLLGMVRSGYMTSLVLLVLCNLATSLEGRAAMLDGEAVECLFGMLKKGEFDSESAKESCVIALYGLSQGGLRFKAMAKAAGAEELLKELGKIGSERLGEKATKMLEVLTEKDEDYEEVDWEGLLNSEDDTSPTRFLVQLAVAFERASLFTSGEQPWPND